MPMRRRTLVYQQLAHDFEGLAIAESDVFSDGASVVVSPYPVAETSSVGGIMADFPSASDVVCVVFRSFAEFGVRDQHGLVLYGF